MCPTLVHKTFSTLFFTAIFPFTIPVATMTFVDQHIYNWSAFQSNALFSKHNREDDHKVLYEYYKARCEQKIASIKSAGENP